MCTDSIILSTTCYCIYSQFQKFRKIFILFIFDFQLEIWGKFCSILEGNFDVKNIIIVAILPSFFSCLGSPHILYLSSILCTLVITHLSDLSPTLSWFLIMLEIFLFSDLVFSLQSVLQIYQAYL